MNLRHRIRIERKTAERSSSGAMTEVWSTFADNVPAEIKPMSARELLAAQAIRPEVTTWITIRWMQGIEPSMRVVHDDDGGRVYQIDGVLPDPTLRREIRLMCSTGVNEGQ